MESYNTFIDIISVLIGLYLGFIAYKAKAIGEVNKTLIWRRDEDFSKCRDKAGFIGYIFIRCMICAVILVVTGGICVLNDLGATAIPYAAMANVIGCVIVIVWYCVFSSQAMKRFFL